MLATNKDNIERILSQFEPGIPISYRELRGSNSHSATRRAITTLCSEKRLLRVMHGFYVRPKRSKILPNITVLCSPEALAQAWANEKGYILVSTSLKEQTQLRFQTQMQIHSVFWSNGPNKKISIGNATAFIQHVPDSYLLWHDQRLGNLYRALIDRDVKYIKANQVKEALSILYSSDSERRKAIQTLLQHKTALPYWRPILLSLLTN